jgi:hypothetical protein
VSQPTHATVAARLIDFDDLTGTTFRADSVIAHPVMTQFLNVTVTLDDAEVQNI